MCRAPRGIPTRWQSPRGTAPVGPAGPAARARTLRLDGGHDVLFGYGNAASTQLRRLFGTNVGRAAYYERNVVVDANRQAHVAYVNRSGKTVATALAGDPPSRLTSIKPSALPELTFRLEENNLRDAHAGVSRSVNKFTKDGKELAAFFFTYELNGSEYVVPGQEPFPTLCESCRYRLRLRITDPDGEVVSVRASTTPQSGSCTGAPQDEVSGVLGNQAPAPTVCTATSASTQTSPQTTVHFCAELTKPGEYEVVKELGLEDGAVDAIFNSAVANSDDFDVTDFRPPSSEAEDRQCASDCNLFCAAAAPDGTDPAVRPPPRVSDDLPGFRGGDAGHGCRPILRDAEAGHRQGRGPGRHPGRHGPRSAPRVLSREEAVRPSGDLPSVDLRAEHLQRSLRLPHDARELVRRGPVCGVPGPFVRLAGRSHAAGQLPGCLLADPSHDPVQIGARLKPEMQAAMQNYLGKVPDFGPTWMRLNPGATALPKISIWDVAAEPFTVVTPTSILKVQRKLDEQWTFFRSLYLGAKQATLAKYLESQSFLGAPNTDYCPYWNHSHAHVKRPDTFSTSEEARWATIGNLTGYCSDVCSVRAREWVSELETTCRTTLSAALKLTWRRASYLLRHPVQGHQSGPCDHHRHADPASARRRGRVPRQHDHGLSSHGRRPFLPSAIPFSRLRRRCRRVAAWRSSPGRHLPERVQAPGLSGSSRWSSAPARTT